MASPRITASMRNAAKVLRMRAANIMDIRVCLMYVWRRLSLIHI